MSAVIPCAASDLQHADLNGAKTAAAGEHKSRLGRALIEHRQLPLALQPPRRQLPREISEGFIAGGEREVLLPRPRLLRRCA